jgi:dihydroorotate dehydrogenase
MLLAWLSIYPSNVVIFYKKLFMQLNSSLPLQTYLCKVMIYRLLRTILFCFPPEAVHYFSMNWLKRFCSIPWIKNWLHNSWGVTDPALTKKVFGLSFSNPVGLGAGFDKNARYLHELEILGFGAVEIGTVTPLAQDGNPKPRLFRLPKDRALINRMGFNNDGADAIAARVATWRGAHPNSTLIVGGNIGKNKVTPNEDAWKDYQICFEKLFDVVDYFVVNVSSPNTPGLRALQDKDALKEILSNLQKINATKNVPKPLLLKIAPDLTDEQLDDIIALSTELKLDGLVASNTTIDRRGLYTDPNTIEAIGMGGLSGKPLTNRSTDVVRYLAKGLNGQVPIIASGGIFTAEDARGKLNAGATLIQVWTGFVYEGPSIVKNICSKL